MQHTHHTTHLTHEHDFLDARGNAEARTWWVVAITVLCMVVEIAAGWWWHSMALMADGWHMGTHALAIGLGGLAYFLARRFARDARFSMGPWKIEVLGAFCSALMLAAVGLWVAVESLWRLWSPTPIDFRPSLIVAGIGMVVNLICAWLLHAGGDPAHQHDLNLRAAYVHVLADALTSVLAIVALLAGLWLGWLWLDAAVGLLGAVMILRWAWGLLIESGSILTDREMDHPLSGKVREVLQRDGDTQVTDLHLMRVGPNRFAAQVSVVADKPFSPQHYRSRLGALPELVHVSVECNVCRGSPREAWV